MPPLPLPGPRAGPSMRTASNATYPTTNPNPSRRTALPTIASTSTHRVRTRTRNSPDEDTIAARVRYATALVERALKHDGASRPAGGFSWDADDASDDDYGEALEFELAYPTPTPTPTPTPAPPPPESNEPKQPPSTKKTPTHARTRSRSGVPPPRMSRAEVEHYKQHWEPPSSLPASPFSVPAPAPDERRPSSSSSLAAAGGRRKDSLAPEHAHASRYPTPSLTPEAFAVVPLASAFHEPARRAASHLGHASAAGRGTAWPGGYDQRYENQRHAGDVRLEAGPPRRVSASASVVAYASAPAPAPGWAAHDMSGAPGARAAERSADPKKLYTGSATGALHPTGNTVLLLSTQCSGSGSGSVARSRAPTR